ncbi:hypothetical protein [Streptomyces glaucescens]|uniref:hypothetical protein n=1 Tax=Streptomyces glaucescens TaxID=1907 RepID=UPI000D1BB9CB|nr:hypothetical protein [Streptomyces glaucescens]
MVGQPGGQRRLAALATGRPHPALGPYGSGDFTTTVAQHMKWVARSGAGVVVTSWWGRGSHEDRLARGILDAAQQEGVKVAWHLSPTRAARPRPPSPTSGTSTAPTALIRPSTARPPTATGGGDGLPRPHRVLGGPLPRADGALTPSGRVAGGGAPGRRSPAIRLPGGTRTLPRVSRSSSG